MSRPITALVASISVGLVFLPSCARQEVLEAPITSATAPVVMECPLGVPHTHIELVETKDGADVFLTTTEQRVADLRRRLRDQAEVHGPRQHVGTGHLGRHDLEHDHGLRLWALPPHEVRVVEAPLGGLLHIAAVNPVHREELLAKLRARIAHLDTRSCPW